MTSFSITAHSDTAIRKLGRGLSNVVTSPLEMPMTMSDISRDKGPAAAFTWGVLEGVLKTVKRAGVGVYETVTFPIPLPAGYKPIIDDPEFLLENMR